jgi:hypothetical protein
MLECEPGEAKGSGSGYSTADGTVYSDPEHVNLEEEEQEEEMRTEEPVAMGYQYPNEGQRMRREEPDGCGQLYSGFGGEDVGDEIDGGGADSSDYERVSEQSTLCPPHKHAAVLLYIASSSLRSPSLTWNSVVPTLSLIDRYDCRVNSNTIHLEVLFALSPLLS